MDAEQMLAGVSVIVSAVTHLLQNNVALDVLMQYDNSGGEVTAISAVTDRYCTVDFSCLPHMFRSERTICSSQQHKITWHFLVYGNNKAKNDS